MTQIERITQMEARLNRCTDAVRALDAALKEYQAALGDMRRLEDYLIGKNWIKDFEADEAGLLPEDLPRGVLSEDGIYNLLEDNRDVQLALSKTLTAIIKNGIL